MISLHVLFPSRAASPRQIKMCRKITSINSTISLKNENINKFDLSSKTWTAPELQRCISKVLNYNNLIQTAWSMVWIIQFRQATAPEHWKVFYCCLSPLVMSTMCASFWRPLDKQGLRAKKLSGEVDCQRAKHFLASLKQRIVWQMISLRWSHAMMTVRAGNM